MTGKPEPALKAGAVVSAIAAIVVFYGLMTVEEVALWTALLGAIIAAALPLIQAKWTRNRVMPIETIEKAGINPGSINKAAGNRG